MIETSNHGNRVFYAYTDLPLSGNPPRTPGKLSNVGLWDTSRWRSLSNTFILSVTCVRPWKDRSNFSRFVSLKIGSGIPPSENNK